MSKLFILIFGVAVYLFSMILIGFLTSRWIKTSKDFLIGGRQIGWIVWGTGITAIIGAGTTVEIGPAFGYVFGFGGMWYFLAWAIGVLTFYFVAKYVRRLGVYTIIEWLEPAYDSSTRNVGSFLFIIGMIAATFAQFVGMGNVLSAYLKINYFSATLIIGLTVAFYCILSGYWAMIITDFYQVLLFVIGWYILIPIILFTQFGGLSFLSNGPNPLPAQLLSFPFGKMSLAAWTMPSVIGLIIMFFMLTSANSGYWMRAASARTDRDMFKGCILAVIVGLPMAIMLPLIGMYVRAAGVKLPGGPAGAFGYLMAQQAAVIAMFLIVANLAATQSTADSGLISLVGVTIRDVYWKLFHRRPADEIKLSRWLVLIYGIVTTFVAAIYPRGALYAIAIAAATFGPLLIFVIDSMLIRLGKKEGAVVSMIMSVIVVLYWEFSGLVTKIHSLYVVIFLTLIFYYGISLIVYFTGPWWGKKAAIPKAVEQLRSGKV